jgi:hypothetical protein
MLLVVTCTDDRHFGLVENAWRSWRGTNSKQKSETLMAVMPTICGTCFCSLHVMIHTFQDYQTNHTYSSKKCIQNHRTFKEICMVTYATNTIFNAWSFILLKGEKQQDPWLTTQNWKVYSILEYSEHQNTLGRKACHSACSDNIIHITWAHQEIHGLIWLWWIVADEDVPCTGTKYSVLVFHSFMTSIVVTHVDLMLLI